MIEGATLNYPTSVAVAMYIFKRSHSPYMLAEINAQFTSSYVSIFGTWLAKRSERRNIKARPLLDY